MVGEFGEILDATAVDVRGDVLWLLRRAVWERYRTELYVLPLRYVERAVLGVIESGVPHLTDGYACIPWWRLWARRAYVRRWAIRVRGHSAPSRMYV
jgi:hypothetical protein